MEDRMEQGLVGLVAGASWRAAAGRASAVFLLGYLVTPLLVGRGGHGVNFVQFGATAAGFLLATVAVFRLLRAEPLSTPADAAGDNAPPPPVDAPMWTAAMLRGLAASRLDMLSAAFYREKGIRVEACPQKAWGGLMLRLFQDNNEEATSLVRCKACDGRPVERRQIEELLHVMVDNATPKAFFVAPDGFSEEAAKLARSAHITPIDGNLLLAMLNRLHDDARIRLRDLVFPAGSPVPSSSAPTEPEPARSQPARMM